MFSPNEKERDKQACVHARETHTHESDEIPAKKSGGRADNWLFDKSSDLHRGTQRVRQPAKGYTQKSKQTKNKYTQTKTRKYASLYVYDCLRSESESASQSSPPQLKCVRVISACAHTCGCPGTISLNSRLCLFVCRNTLSHTCNTKNTKTQQIHAK